MNMKWNDIKLTGGCYYWFNRTISLMILINKYLPSNEG